MALVGLAVTAAVTATARLNYLDNEQHLVTLQTRLTASTLRVTPVDLERRLGKAAGVAALTGGSTHLFEQTIATSAGGKGPLAVAELFRVTAGGPQLLASAGGRPLLPPSSPRMVALAGKAVRRATLAVTHLVRPGAQRLGYAMASTTPGTGDTYVVYGEQVLPADRKAAVSPASPDAALHFAVYFGKTVAPAHLLESDTTRLPLTGTTSRQVVPFGDTELTLVASARGSLAGPFASVASWVIMALGLLFTAGVTLLAARLVTRGRSAEVAAIESERLYASERRLSETLQQALLPARLPALPGVELASRYFSGARGVEVGGDWYDVVERHGRELFFCVGDVSGRGVEAAVLMAQVRHAVNAHVADGADPASVLTKVGPLLDVGRDGHFATVLCGLLRLHDGDLVVANAGHLPPVLVDGDRATLVRTEVGPPIGIGTSYRATEHRLPPGGTLLAVTDGLVERRGESLDVGLERLRSAAGRRLDLEVLLDEVVGALLPEAGHDDVAMLGIRWHGAPAAPDVPEAGEPVASHSPEP